MTRIIIIVRMTCPTPRIPWLFALPRTPQLRPWVRKGRPGEDGHDVVGDDDDVVDDDDDDDDEDDDDDDDEVELRMKMVVG